MRVNEKLAAMNGAPAGSHLGRTLKEVLPAPLAGRLEPLYRRVLETGQPLLDHEIHVPAGADGSSERDWLIACSPVLTDNAAVLGLQIVTQDISERKRAERELPERVETTLVQLVVGATLRA